MTSIVGWAHTRFGRLDDSLVDLIGHAAESALTHAELDGHDIDEVVVATYNAGLQPLAFPSSVPLERVPTLRGVPCIRVENACASGTAAIHHGIRSIESGRARQVLVIGAEKMTDRPAQQIGAALLGADLALAGSESTVGFAGLFGQVAAEYRGRYGLADDTLARIAHKAHRNALDNPWAQLHRELSVEFCATTSAANPVVAPPLRRTDCSPVSDGAAAVVLAADAAVPARCPRQVRVAGIGQASDFLDRSRRDLLEFAGARAAWGRALDEAGVRSPRHLDLIELHDCFTIAELVLYEALGLAANGRGVSVLDEGVVYADGPLPVNRSGGLKAKGHPVGATGVSQHVLCAMQLTGTAGAMQLPNPRLAGVFNMGGLAVANHATILGAVA
ncbi:MAG TPA: thiolase domain-containing protein [Phycicoccus sp.]|nr:thiolase domain-containing protein [Phycicoccus sp.]